MDKCVIIKIGIGQKKPEPGASLVVSLLLPVNWHNAVYAKQEEFRRSFIIYKQSKELPST